MKFSPQIIYFLVGFYFLVCFLLFLLQEQLIFLPEKLPADHVFHFNGDFEEKFFQLDSKTTIHSLYFYAKNPKGVILYFHGNAGSLNGWGDVAEGYVRLGYDVLIPDYRGFGKSRGAKSEATFYSDAELLFDFLLEKYDASQIIIYGRSLGTGVAVDLASKREAQQLILETPFSSLANVAQNRMKIFPVKLLLKYHFRSDQKIKKVKYPIHVFHGTNDGIVPVSESHRLIDILKTPQILTLIEGGEHNNLPSYEIYWKKIIELLK